MPALLAALLAPALHLAAPAAPAPSTAAAPPGGEPFLQQYLETRGFGAGRPVRARLMPDGDAVLFLRSGPRSPVQALFTTDLATGATRELATAERLLAGAAAEVPELDLARVGVEGWSFGGYFAALAVMRYPESFRAAVAGAPVVDWQDYDTAYTERYLGLPEQDRPAYQRSSLLTWAPRLDRPLLLVHGTADDNVYFFHSHKLSDALLRAGKRHELLVLPGLTHLAMGAGEPAHVARLWERVVGFFEEALAAPGPE